VAAEREAHDRFMASPEAGKIIRDKEKTPGYLLLQRLRQGDDEEAVRLFRAMEMYYHELTRADIAAAYLRGKEVGRTECCNEQS